MCCRARVEDQLRADFRSASKALESALSEVDRTFRFPDYFTARIRPVHPHAGGGLVRIRESQGAHLGIKPRIPICQCHLYLPGTRCPCLSFATSARPCSSVPSSWAILSRQRHDLDDSRHLETTASQITNRGRSMSANPIDLDARRSCPNLEARSSRPRRWSADPARHSYYHWARQRRLARRLLGR